MDKKEQLFNAYCSYLPHKTQIIQKKDWHSDDWNDPEILILDQLTYPNKEWFYVGCHPKGNFNSHSSYENDQFKLCLLPLSALTEETEHPVTGEKFVPLDELRKERWGKQLTWFGDDKRSFPEAYNSIDGLMIETDDYSIDIEISEVDFIKERLIEWHFNVFDLPQEMWVDKRTIKQ